VRGLFLGGSLLALEVGLAPFAFDYFVVLFAHDV
jgi:hypothetical protein